MSNKHNSDPPAYSDHAPDGQDYIHTGENTEINLGPMYGLDVPAYGRGACVRGTVRLRNGEHIKSVEAKVNWVTNSAVGGMANYASAKATGYSDTPNEYAR